MTSATIECGHHVLFKLANDTVKSVQVNDGTTVTAGRAGSFPAALLFGQIYGLSYEVMNNKIREIPPPSIQDIDDTDATNELITDGEFVQPLTAAEIETLKVSGVHASDIIKKQIEQHANYSLKTEYSKEKYKKRKEAKYLKSFTTIPPTLFNVCEYWFKKDPSRVRDIRCDTISQMMNLASIRPGGRYLAVDGASGIVVAAILQRLGGSGRLLTICDTESPPTYPVTQNMNFPPGMLEPLASLNWSTAEPEYTPVLDSNDASEESNKTDRKQARLNKRKAAQEKLLSIRAELFAGEFDGLVIACEYDLMSILERLEPYLAGSSSIVVQSPHCQILVDLQLTLRSLPQYLSPGVTESWLRQYQVLPGRTHPTMNTSGTGGYILQTFKVYDDPQASSVLSHRKQKQKKPTPEQSSERLVTEAIED